MKKNFKTVVGVIGFGSFGRFISDVLRNYAKVIVCDNSDNVISDEFKVVSLEEVCVADIVILAVPLSSYGDILPKISHNIKKSTLLIDICSVKTLPEELFDKFLPDHKNILLTHPLFGPQSASGGLKGHDLVVTKQAGERAGKVVAFCREKLQLNISGMSAAKHDKAMASIHALTFFVARALSNMRLEPAEFKTPSFKMIEDLITLDRAHSEELFRTVELGNPFAKDIYSKFVREVTKLEEVLQG